MQSFRSHLLVAVVTLCASLLVASDSHGQPTESEPIYLEEPGSEPPAPISRRQKIKEVYEDKSPRAEREVAQLSNDRVLNDGKYTEYYRDGQKFVEGNYKLGVFDGEWSYWFPNGQLCKKVSFSNGKTDGQWEVFDKEGKRISQKSYKGGMRHGKWIVYYESGEVPKFEISYEQGKPVGERITYYESGSKKQLISFKNGKMDGMMTEWDESGNKVAEAKFEDGKLVGEVERFTK